MTIKAELHYGYDLGDANGEGWQFAELGGEYDSTPTVSWWDEDGDDFAEQAMEQLLRAAGFTETDWRAVGYYDRRRAAEATIGVAFEHTGYEAARTLIVAKGREYGAYTSDVTELDPAAMGAAADEAANEALANALKVLGITPKQEKPAWLLTCYHG
jgi:hypothetical protein